MDSKKEEQLAQEQLEELKQALENFKGGQEHVSDTESVSTGPLYDSCGTIAGYDYSGGSSVSQASYTLSAGAGTNGTWLNQGAGLTFSSPTANTTISSSPWWGSNTATNVSGKLQLNGENADIEINGVSLMTILQDRLNVLIPNPEIEQEWDELKELGDRYRELEAELKEKSKMWALLKKEQKPTIY